LPKLLETLMFNRLNQLLQCNKIVAPEQFGFRKETNIENAVFTLMDIVCKDITKPLSADSRLFL
jgi:hypothetical protein